MRHLLAFGAVALLVACTDDAAVLNPDGSVEAGVDAALDVTPDQGQADVVADDASDASADTTNDVVTTCNTGFELCNGVCTDITTYQTDNTSCGYCQHDCKGNACTTGMCAPDTIGTGLPNPVELAVDGTNVYMTTSGDGVTIPYGQVYQCPVTGCPTKLGPMTSNLDNPVAIAVDSTHVYWNNASGLSSTTGSVMSCPLTDCGKLDASRKTIAKNLTFVQGLALDATNVYFGTWGAAPFFGKGTIDACPLAGCPGAPKGIITGQSKPGFVAVDGADLFMAARGGNTAIPYVQSNPIATPGAGTALWSGTIQNQIAGFTLFGGNFYFADGFGGTIELCAETGCTTPAILTSGLSAPFSLAVDAKGMYWLDDSGIEFCPLKGCTLPTLLATPTNYPQALAINGSYVYWVEQDGTGLDGHVMRVAR
jgi:hypothetical protein